MDETFGQLLRRLRTARGMSQRLVAELWAEAHIRQCESSGSLPSESAPTRHEIRRYERGGRVPSTATLRPFAEVFDVPLSVLESAAAHARRVRSLGEMALNRTQVLPGSTWGRRDAAELSELLSSSGSELDEATALRVAHEWLLADPPQLIELDAGRRVGATLTDRIERRLHDLRRLDDFLTGPDIADVVDAELRANVTLLTEASFTEQIGRRLLGLTADLAQLAGWVASDLGKHRAAECIYLGGMRAAHAAGDSSAAANLLSSLSYQEACVGDPRRASLLAKSAYRGARGAPRLVKVLLLERMAWARARAGDRAETERLLGLVDETFEETLTGDEPAWVYWLDRGEIDVMAGRCYTELGLPLRAQPLLSRALKEYETTHIRETALYLSWLAESYLQAGEADAAVAEAMRALDLSTQVESARVLRRLGELRRRLSAVGGATARVFEDRYRAIQASPSAARSLSPVTLAGSALGAETEEDNVDRRKFLSLSTAPVLAQLEAIRQRMGVDAGQSLSAAEVDQRSVTADAHVARYGSTAPALLLERLAPDLTELAELCARYPHQRDLQLVTAKLCGLVGALHTDLEQTPQARSWLQTSAHYAAISGSLPHRWWTAMALAMLALYDRKPGEVLRIAARSRAALGNAECAAAAQLAGLAARAHTTLSDDAHAREELNRAEHLFAGLREADTDEQFFGFPERELTMYRSQVLSGIGDSSAWEAQEYALAAYPADDPMDRPLIMLDRARMLVRQGNAHDAATVGGDAIGSLSPVLKVPLLMTQARALGREIAKISSQAAEDFRVRVSVSR